MHSRFQVEDGSIGRAAMERASKLRIEISQFAGGLSFEYEIVGDVELRDVTDGRVDVENLQFFERLVSTFLGKGGAQ